MYISGGVAGGTTIVTYSNTPCADTTSSQPCNIGYPRTEQMDWKEWEEKQYQALLVEILYNRYLNNLLYKVPKIKLGVLKNLCTTCIKETFLNWAVRALKQL